jgi:hypothetical protein
MDRAHRVRTGGIALLLFITAAAAQAVEFEIVSWNVESGGDDPNLIAQQIEAFSGVELWGLCEVDASNQRRYGRAAGIGEGAFFEPILGTTGGGDRLLVIYNTEFFEAVDDFELDHLKFGGGRAPLVVHLKTRGAGVEFLFVNNHFHRGNANKRKDQARGFRKWASEQTLPVIAVGDYNFDYEVPNGPGNESFDLLMENDVFEWIKPQTIVATQYSDSDDDGQNDRNSVLDFVFVAKRAAGWEFTTEIVVKDGDFPDNDETSDHRAIQARARFPDAPQRVESTGRPAVRRAAAPAAAPSEDTQATLKEILERLKTLETEVRKIRGQQDEGQD